MTTGGNWSLHEQWSSGRAVVYRPDGMPDREVNLRAPRRRVSWLPLWVPFNSYVDEDAAWKELAAEVRLLRCDHEVREASDRVRRGEDPAFPPSPRETAP